MKRGEQGAAISYDVKAPGLARRLAKEQTADYREVYLYRTGIEATNSDQDRLTGTKRLRVRGMMAVRRARRRYFCLSWAYKGCQRAFLQPLTNCKNWGAPWVSKLLDPPIAVRYRFEHFFKSIKFI